MKSKFKQGQMVILLLDGVTGIPGDLKKHNLETFRVSKVREITDGKSTWVMYELEGLTSMKGIPYSIPNDWLYEITAESIQRGLK